MVNKRCFGGDGATYSVNGNMMEIEYQYPYCMNYTVYSVLIEDCPEDVIKSGYFYEPCTCSYCSNITDVFPSKK